MAISLSTSASMKMMSQISQESFLDFFENNLTWSLLKFFYYRMGTKSFTYEKDKEHMLYRSMLISLSNERARICLLAFEEKTSQSVESFWNGIEKNCLNDNIKKRSLEYINETINDSVKNSKTARNYLSNELKSFVTNFKKRDCSPMENS
ncbi:unnamed protein product [Rhizophagus irregularis]|nr:unnamed protein product [Rhizophagus irregularis]